MSAKNRHSTDRAGLIAKEHAQAHRQKSLGNIYHQGNESRFLAEHPQNIRGTRVAAALFFDIYAAELS